MPMTAESPTLESPADTEAAPTPPVTAKATAMQFSIDKDTFQQAIQAVQRATATRVIQPILANILIESVASDRLKLSATDLDFAIEAIVPAMILTPGRTTVSGRKLAEILAKLPTSAPLQATLDPATQQLHLISGKAKFDIRTMSADEFPTIRQIDNASALNVNLKTLLRGIQQTAFAAAGHETNNVLGGVYFQLSTEGLEMAATDGSRLAKRVEATPPDESKIVIQETVSAIIPAKALQEVAKLVVPQKDDDTVRLAIQDGQIAFKTDTLYVLSRLLDGQYPKYNQLIPTDNTLAITANRKALIESLERVAVMANDRTNVVKMTVDNTQLSLVANTPDVGDSQDSMEVVFNGTEPLNIAFNYRYILDALKVIDAEDVRIEMKGPLTPTLFKSAADTNFLCLVMPVQVK
jgi:DNA polymerase-3 subunit beta